MCGRWKRTGLSDRYVAWAGLSDRCVVVEKSWLDWQTCTACEKEYVYVRSLWKRASLSNSRVAHRSSIAHYRHQWWTMLCIHWTQWRKQVTESRQCTYPSENNRGHVAGTLYSSGDPWQAKMVLTYRMWLQSPEATICTSPSLPLKTHSSVVVSNSWVYEYSGLL